MNLQTFFNPSCIAIIGVSHEKTKVGYLVASNMISQGFEGSLYFINPKGGNVLGKEMLTSINDIQEQVDLAVLAVPADVAIPYLDELKAKNITNVVLFAAGFKEIGEEGMEREKALVQKAHDYGITLLGPNCIGYINTVKKINTTFLKSVAPVGNIGFVSQSGALGSVMVDEFVARHNFGLSYFVSMGNKTIVDESDVLEFLANDDSTQVIAMYLEDVKDGEKFKKILTNTTLRKPVIILKSGTTAEGSKAAMSHTGGLVGDDAVYSSLFKQCGAIRARDYTEFTTLLRIFSFDRVPSTDHVLVLSNAGGVGVLLADQLVTENLSLVTVTDSIKNELTKEFGESKKISVRNPIDLLGDASAFDYEKAIRSTLQEKNVGAVIILLTPQANTQILETAKVIVKAQQGFDKPIYPVFMGKQSVKEGHDLFEEKRVASFRTHDYLTKAISKAVWYKNYLSTHAGHVESLNTSVQDENQKQQIQAILQKPRDMSYLNLQDSLDVMKLAGIPVVEMVHAESVDAAKAAAQQFGYPVTVKIASDAITHKTEVKGVFAGIPDEQILTDVFTSMTTNPKAPSNGVYVQKQVKGHELFIGAKRDPNFGVVVLTGLGGIYAELFKDIAYRIFPFSQNEFISLLKETKMFKLLSGFRGGEAADFGVLYDAIYKIGYLLETQPAIKEIDLNPLFITADQVTAVDARIIV